PARMAAVSVSSSRETSATRSRRSTTASRSRERRSAIACSSTARRREETNSLPFAKARTTASDPSSSMSAFAAA
ncbi:unnamed protein product, partial [Penicillium discolor]